MLYRQRGRARESGFTLIEVLSAVALMSILMTLGAFAMRQFWFQRALYGEQDEIVTQLRSLQEKVTAESNPLVYGAKFSQGGNATSWDLIQYDPARTSGTRCRRIGTVDMDAGVRVQQSRFDNEPTTSVAAICKDELGGALNDYVFFFSRGTAVSGGVAIVQPNLDDRRISVCVNGLTGRVTKLDGAGEC